MPSIQLATDRDLRGVSHRDQDALLRLPYLYIPADEPGVMRVWGVARSDGDADVAFYARKHPEALVAPRYMGERADRGELLYNGAEPAADFK